MHPTAGRSSVVPNDGMAACMGGDRARACEASHAVRVLQGPRPRQRGALLRQGERRAGERLRGPNIAVRDGFLGGG